MPITIQHSVNKRQADFLAGRYAAKSILTQFGINNIDVPIGVHRSPVWPKNINGSISHTHDRAICIASTNYAHKFIGCDIELLISNQTRVEIGDSIIDNYEKEILIKAFNDVNIAYVIVFSAKESLFKALYPTVNEYFDFDTAQLVDIDIKNQRFKIKLVKPLHSILPKGKVFLGYYFIGNGVVTTVVIE
jgi:4'-phosphopantetheinyl transferase EntD